MSNIEIDPIDLIAKCSPCVSAAEELVWTTRESYVASFGEVACQKIEKEHPRNCPWLKAESTLDTGIKDSGARRDFATGAQRDRGVGNSKQYRRYDLLPVHAMHRLAVWYGKGAAKYSARNWEKGMPLSEYHNSAEAHRMKMLAGYTDEDHLSAWIWNVACFVETKERIELGLLPKELDDMPTTCAGLTPKF